MNVQAQTVHAKEIFAMVMENVRTWVQALSAKLVLGLVQDQDHLILVKHIEII